MSALEAATLASELARANDASSLAARFAEALYASAGACHVLCYGIDASHSHLQPLGYHPMPSDPPPPIRLDGGAPSFLHAAATIEKPMLGSARSLVGDTSLFGNRFDETDTLLVMPLRTSSWHGLIVLGGVFDMLQAWRYDMVWQRLVDTYGAQLERLSSGARIASKTPSPETGIHPPHPSRAADIIAAGFIGPSASARRVRERMRQVATSSLSLLITGETGTGKDHAAHLIHRACSRTGRFVAVNCAAIPRELIEAELFGATRGAYTGAVQARTGLVAEAHGGTLFLDEIGDMPLSLQGALLRLLNEKTYRPVGATKELASDFRLICATHRCLPDKVEDGSFREDLYYRIRQQVLHMPPLRERSGDLPYLTAHLLQQYVRESGRPVDSVTDAALAWLAQAAFRGNIRELRSVLYAAAELTATGDDIDVPVLIEVEADMPRPTRDDGSLRRLLHTRDLPAAVKSFERMVIHDRLQRGGSKRQIARSLGLPERTFSRKCMGLDVGSLP